MWLCACPALTEDPAWGCLVILAVCRGTLYPKGALDVYEGASRKRTQGEGDIVRQVIHVD